jgi:hypothetical protein
MAAGNGYEFLVLHIEQLGEVPACGLELVGFILCVAAFCANEFELVLIHLKHSFICPAKTGSRTE